MVKVNRSADKLKKEVTSEVTKMFETILDYAHVACSQPDTFRALRAKILRAGNNCIRNLSVKVDQEYDISYVAKAEDVIEVKNK